MLLSEAISPGVYFHLVPWVVFFPVLGLLALLVFGGKMSEKAIGWTASAASGLAFVVAALQAYSLAVFPQGRVVPLADWISLDQVHLRWAFQVDTLSATMMLVVSGVGTLIHIYSIGYMHEDVRINGDPGRFRRFFVFMNLFIAAMMVLVSSDNYLMLFVGWEGVGLCSYLLIGFWYDKGKDGIGNAIAGKKAFIMNRIGDFGFLVAAFIMFWTFRSLEFHAVFERAPEVAQLYPGAILAITLFMLLGVTGKSAQLPLYIWLPEAMAGPTPVSALIHAATMVTAGVYLIARSHALYVLEPQAQGVVTLVGGLTALFAATIAVGQFDIKKVLAYSTISQLGFMVAAVGMGAFTAGIFHLVTHSFFKALLFLSAGSVIQGVEHGHHEVEHNHRLKKFARERSQTLDPQDMRSMGGLRTRMPVTFWVYLIGALALAGIPPLAGFWSKDEILAEAAHLNAPVYWLLVAAAFFTAFYMGRQVLMIFFGESRSTAAEHARENPPIIVIPLLALAGLSVVGGALNLPGAHTLTIWLAHTLEGEVAGEFNLLVAGLSVGLAIAAAGLAWYFYVFRTREFQRLPTAKRPDDPLRAALGPVFSGMNNRWWLDEVYWTTIPGWYKTFTCWLAERMDLGGIDALVNGSGGAFQKLASAFRLLQTGYVRNYALSIFLGVVVIVGYLLMR